MKEGHEFSKEHGFTGSHQPEKNFRPKMPAMKADQNSPLVNKGSNDDEMSVPSKTQAENFKRGGLTHIKSHTKNYAHGPRGEFDKHPKGDQVKYDEFGYQSHKKMK